jgi:3-phosphoshikimate 1-carboxyvinyltransferase
VATIEIWDAPAAAAPVRGRVRVPGSKSLTNRALVLAALCDGPSRLRAPLRSRDTLLMAGGLRALGVEIVDDGPDWQVRPAALRGPAEIDCGNAGTVARFLPPVAALATGAVSFRGDPRMSERPLAPLLGALRALGTRIDGEAVPLTVHGRGRLPGGVATLDASTSSQLVSGLLLAAGRADCPVELRHVGPPVPSALHLEMTVRMLTEHGINVRVEVGPDSSRWVVEPGPMRAVDRLIEPDLSSASAFLAAAVATGGEVAVEGWPAQTSQPGRLLPGLLTAMGAHVTLGDDGLRIRGPERVLGIDVDLHDHGEAVPTLTALAVLACSPSRLRGVGHLRLQETDRLSALAEELGKLGARIEVHPDGLEIRPAPLRAHPGTVLDPRADHRLAMAFAVVALRVPGLRMSDPATTAKTVPGFPGMWSDLLGG